ncbi:MAG: CYTH and CHAD domain-containing protein [Frankia sp.]|nr:CYTH and CHAD domain-containing protein [Frankia sp.]
MNRQREIERKFSVGPEFVLPALVGADEEAGGDAAGGGGGVPGVAALGEPRTFTQEAVYFDSDDLRLARAKITLRRRTGGEDDGWHLKLPAGGGARDEIRRPLEDGEPDERGIAHSAPPADLLDIVFLRLRGARVRPIARLVTTRTATSLLDAGGAEIAEIVDDRVSAQTLGEATMVTGWREIEVELAGDDADAGEKLLDEIGAALVAAGAGPAPHGSKLAHLLGSAGTELAAPPEETRAGAKPAKARKRAARTAGAIVRDYLAAQVAAIHAVDPRVRLDEPDAVHRMRVACRRLRSSLRTFAPLFPPDLVSHLDVELRDLAGALSGARDAEVQLAYFADRLDALPAELVRGPVQETLTDRLSAGMAAGREAALAALRSERYLVLLVELDDLLRTELTERADRPATEELPKLVRAADRRLARKVATAAATPPGHDRDVLLHSARKQAKRLRYAGEALVPVFGQDARTLARLSEEAQELLGIHQDATVACGLLRTWGLEAQEAGEPTAFTLGLLLGLEEHRARTAERDFFDAWPELSAARHRRWLR